LAVSASYARAQGHGGGMDGHGADMGHVESHGAPDHEHDHDHDHNFKRGRFLIGSGFVFGGVYFDGFYPYAYDPYYFPYYYPPPVVYAPPATEVLVSATPVPGQANCRMFESTIVVGGGRQPVAGTACQQADGSWHVSH
jgi:hypothetical protein